MDNPKVPEYPPPTGEETLEDVQAEFPGWRIWRGIDWQYYATRREGGICGVRGEDPTDLRDQIIGAEKRRAAGTDGSWWAPHVPS